MCPVPTGLAVSHDSALLVSISHDKSVKVFDVASFDMMAMLRLPFVPACAEWISKARSPGHAPLTWLVVECYCSKSAGSWCPGVRCSHDVTRMAHSQALMRSGRTAMP